MAPGKAPCRRRSSDSGVEPDRGALPRDREQRAALSQKKRDQRIALFLSDFDQQAKEHIQEMKKELDSLLQTAEKAFAVELLTMPAAVRKMKRKDVLAGSCRGHTELKPEPLEELEFTVSLNLQGREEVALAAAVTDCSVEDMPNPKLVRTNSKKVKVTTIVEYEDAKQSSAKKITKKISKTRSLVSLASGLSGKLDSLSSVTNLKATPNGAKSAGLQQTVSRTLPASGRVQGMLKRSKSVPQHKSVPFVNIPLADGQTLCTAGGDLRNIDVQLLNQDTVQHIHNLVSELTVLCGKATPKPR
ncbi:borealin-2-like isoform X1 [Anomalospiza imberbis]|uniref:borealin-2-like isoform X1 n=1 Tax=Anomalospiza imberbis TaxID=187417 RepID=UPI0035901F57